MDAALLLIAGNETCPQPQTSEHLAAIEIMRLEHIISRPLFFVVVCGYPVWPSPISHLYRIPPVVFPLTLSNTPLPLSFVIPPPHAVLQNKIDLLKEKEAKDQYSDILAFVNGTVAEGAPIIPISAQLKYNIGTPPLLLLLLLLLLAL